MKNFRHAILTLLLSMGITAQASMGILLNPASSVDMTATYANEVYTFTTTGTDPRIVSYELEGDAHIADIKLEFQYQSSADIDDVQFFFMSPEETEAKSLHVKNLIKKTNQWTTVSVNIGQQRGDFNWGSKGNKLRIDFGDKPGVTVKMRLLGINGSYYVSDEYKNAETYAIAKYLGAAYPSAITRVDVNENTITISGTASSPGKLLHVPLHENAALTRHYDPVANLTAGDFSITVDRYVTVANGLTYDRLLSKWMVVDNDYNILSHARYADNISAIRKASPGVLYGKKGVGNLSDDSVADLDALSEKCVTLNIWINWLISMTPKSGYIPYEYCGRTYYINPERQDYYDRMTKACVDRGIVVAAILLFNVGGGDNLYAATMVHPENQGGYYTMPNCTTWEGIHTYAATMNYLANRYSTPGNGRIHHWIMHNEVDAHYIWTNMGQEQPMIRYMDHYERSMRLASNIVRQYDPNAYILASFTSSWADTNGGFSAKQMMEQLVNFGNAEGDYRWGIAAHPYPQDFWPNLWEHDTQATYSENAKYVSFKNLEVISDWMLRREHYYKGQEKRILFLSENGANSMDNSAKNLQLQAAAAAWAWKKTQANAGIDGIMWHNWWDNPEEGGLHLGLRDQNKNPKPSWYVWQAAGTSRESEVLDPYLSTIGISDWGAIHHYVEKTDAEFMRIELNRNTTSGMTCQFQDYSQIYTVTANSDDPQIQTVASSQPLSSNSNVMAFEYQSNKNLDLQFFFTDPPSENLSLTSSLSATTGNEWKRVYVNIAGMRAITGAFNNAGSKLRIDPGRGWNADNTLNFKIRHLCITNGGVSDIDAQGLNAESAIQSTVTDDTDRGVYTIRTTGTDPGVYSNRLRANLSAKADKLLFEYQSSSDVDMHIYFCDEATQYRMVQPATLPATNSWKRAVVDLSPVIKNSGWGFHGDYLRIDPGYNSGVTFKMRNLVICDASFVSEYPLVLDNRDTHDLVFSRDSRAENADGTSDSAAPLQYDGWAISTIGSDPFVLTNPLMCSLNDEASKLHIVYKSDVNISPLELFFLDPMTQTRAKKYYDVMPATDEWKHIVIDIADMRREFGWGYAGNVLRLDFANNIGSNIRIQSLYINDSDDTCDNAEEFTDLHNTWNMFGTTGGVNIVSESPRPFIIYNTIGIPVARVTVEGRKFVPLPRGIYLSHGKKLIVN